MRAIAVGTVVLALAAAACGGDDGGAAGGEARPTANPGLQIEPPAVERCVRLWNDDTAGVELDGRPVELRRVGTLYGENVSVIFAPDSDGDCLVTLVSEDDVAIQLRERSGDPPGYEVVGGATTAAAELDPTFTAWNARALADGTIALR